MTRIRGDYMDRSTVAGCGPQLSRPPRSRTHRVSFLDLETEAAADGGTAGIMGTRRSVDYCWTSAVPDSRAAFFRPPKKGWP